MSKKNLLGNIIGAPKSDTGDTNSQGSTNNSGTGNEPAKEPNGGGEVPPVLIVKETPKETPIVKKTPIPIIIETPIAREQAPDLKPHVEVVATKLALALRMTKKEVDYINALVIHKRLSGEINFSKRQAISDAILLLMAEYPIESLLSSPQR